MQITNYTDLLRGFQGVIENYLSRFVATVTPCVVVHVAGNRVDVKNALHHIDDAGLNIDPEIIPDIPILMLSGGANSITFDVAPGDFGLLIACKNDITEFKKKFASGVKMGAKITTPRSFSFSDGFYLPLSLTSGDGIKIKSGGADIKISDDTVTINAPTVKISGDLKVDGDVVSCGVSLTKHTHKFKDLTIGVGVFDNETLAPEAKEQKI